MSASDNITGHGRGHRQEDLRQRFQRHEKSVARLEAIWPEYVAGNTSDFTEQDWALIELEKAFRAEASLRRVREHAVRLAIAMMVLVGMIALAVWGVPAIVEFLV
ncbi:hypothetical protein FOS14_19635 [Skermania sp. ID1734]|uniref:hypothetical protein n=1 Tax=Skermania sp. ID1734 TaxID=2597516 RepID=UPI00117D8A74|nr:hypothetical protein [Skermania sp. ID1734]TSD94855.1 hypothetical protein FOS14_19635 [Skermania sp. ID1734]